MPEDTLETTLSKQPKTGVVTPSLEGVRILLVEDNRINLAMAKEFLEEAGVNVSVAVNGAEAIGLLSRDHFDCVLMDIQMPVMDGYEATRLMRANPALAAVPVIAMTVSDSDKDLEQRIAAGMNDFISKPFMPDALYSTIARWLGPLQQKPTATAPAPAMESMPDPSDIDLPGALAWMGGDRQKMRKLLLEFLSDARASVANIESALSRNDFAAIGALAHYISGPARMAGATGFTNLCRALQAAIKNNDSREHVQDIVSQMRPLLDRIHERHIP